MLAAATTCFAGFVLESSTLNRPNVSPSVNVALQQLLKGKALNIHHLHRLPCIKKASIIQQDALVLQGLPLFDNANVSLYADT